MLWGTLDGPDDRDRQEKYARLPSYRVRRSGEDDYTTIISIRLIVFRYSTSGRAVGGKHRYQCFRTLPSSPLPRRKLRLTSAPLGVDV